MTGWRNEPQSRPNRSAILAKRTQSSGDPRFWRNEPNGDLYLAIVAVPAWKADAPAAHWGRPCGGGSRWRAFFRSLNVLWEATRLARTPFCRFVKTLVYALIRRRFRPDLGPGIERRCRLPLRREEVALV